MQKKVLLVIAHSGFQPQEYGDPKMILEEAGITVVTASDTAGPAISSFGNEVPVDLTISKVNPADYDGIFLIGGPGALQHLDNETTHQLLKKVAKDEKPWGAICISPRILAHAGVLSGKKVTGWNNDGKLDNILQTAKAAYTAEPYTEDGNLITADGPASAALFGEAILRHLTT